MKISEFEILPSRRGREVRRAKRGVANWVTLGFWGKRRRERRWKK